MSGQPEIEVLLATYNGERFLREQIDSVLRQSWGNTTLLAADDGSGDETRAILEEYAAAYPGRVRVLAAAAPTGSAKRNFARLLRASRAPYVAFCDQDDHWLPRKLEGSMAAMRGLEAQHPAGTPLLVFTDLAVVDDALRPLYPSFWAHQNIDPRGILRFPRTVVQNVVTGCTALMNRPLAELAADIPAGAFMHDWWVALLAAGLGAAAWLPEPTVLYRQHGANVVGAAEHPRVTGVPKWRQHGERRRQWEQSVRQAEAFALEHGGRLAPAKRRQLEAYVRSEHHRSRLVRTGGILRHGFFLKGLRANLAILWYLWDMEAAKRTGP